MRNKQLRQCGGLKADDAVAGLGTVSFNFTAGPEKVRDVFLGGPIDGYTSTLHSLDGINYPEHFWKATIENEREKLTTARPI